ncbi:MAG: restriction endonuclease [Armatimonadota bacterium]|nr:restriction endonuclease [Armatimonadota bacterium]MDR7574386.1 restriction endonuclease [Armatimonadota bacterium]MDR7586787.1 restriction endonuclease [Armatimonadota bacterium]
MRRYEKIVRFSSIKAVKAGWLVKERGRWSLTDEGRKALESYQDPQEFARQADRLYKRWKASLPEEHEEEVEEAPAPGVTLEEAEEMAWREVEEYLLHLDPYDFQTLVRALLQGMGYHVAWVAPPGPDGGTDLIAYSDPLGTRQPRVRVQVKRRQEKISVEGLRAFMAVLGNEDIGLFISTGGFTKDAEQEARSQPTRRITLLDLEKLFDLWVQYYKNVPEEGRRILPLKPVYYLAREDLGGPRSSRPAVPLTRGDPDGALPAWRWTH